MLLRDRDASRANFGHETAVILQSKDPSRRRCRTCGYDVQSLAVDRCPECGRPPLAAKPAPMMRRATVALLLSAIVFLLVIALGVVLGYRGSDVLVVALLGSCSFGFTTAVRASTALQWSGVMAVVWAGLSLMVGIFLVAITGAPLFFLLPAAGFVPVAAGVVLGLAVHVLRRLLW